jgi:hypothetical protein
VYKTADLTVVLSCFGAVFAIIHPIKKGFLALFCY